MFYYLALDNPSPGFDAVFESSTFSNNSNAIEAIAKTLKLKSIFDLMSLSEYNSLMPEGCEEAVVPWFDPQEGIDWLAAVIAAIQKDPSTITDSKRLIADLLKCQGILKQAQEINAKWHFGMDI
jgi:hypothetical protein